jgi:hypothetical protein
MTVMGAQRSGWTVAIAVAALVAVITACGGPQGGHGGDDAPSGVVVTISPTTASLAAAATQQFVATVTGTSNTGVSWSASGGTITSAGLYTAPAVGGGYAIRATSAADPAASATAIVNVSGDGSVLEPFYDSQHPYAQVMSPMPFATYFAPATIRVWAHAPDVGNDSVNGYSPHVDFFLGTQMVGSVSIGKDDPIDYYQVDVPGVPAGSYELYVRSRLGSDTVESMHVPVEVIAVPTGGPTMELTSDLMLTGSNNFELIGTPSAPAALTSSNGSRIRSAANWSGHLTIRNTNIIGLGAMDIPGIEVTVRGTNAIEITDSVFDRCGPPLLTANDQAPITIRNTTFQPNMLTPATDKPDDAGSHPSLVLAGTSTAHKVFAGNNVGMALVQFNRSSHWMVGGDHDADGNVFLGVRAGMEFDDVNDITIRGNFSYHRYPFGWSQGHNLVFRGNNSDATIEHNVFRSSSWMIQSIPSGEFRYNLLLDNINESFFRYFDENVKVHHNVLVNSSWQRTYSPTGGITFANGAFYNNTVDAGGPKLGWVDSPFAHDDSLSSVRNNVFTGFAYQGKTPVIDAGAAKSADYNCFFNPDTTTLQRYGDTGPGAHDCGGGASTDPKFAQSRVIPFPISDGDVWRRTITVSQILALYRNIYTPTGDSPLIDKGDPNDGSGADIGAVGAGAPHPEDQFGRFGP